MPPGRQTVAIPTEIVVGNLKNAAKAIVQNTVLQVGEVSKMFYEPPKKWVQRLVGMCSWMGSHFHGWIDYSGVSYSIQLLERVAHFRDFGSKKILQFN